MTTRPGGTSGGPPRAVPALAGAVVFLSAALLFTVQLCVGKITLPWFGGSAAVWATSIVFYQALLLAGYAYADLVVRRVPPRLQAALHVAVLGASLFFLPIGPGPSWRPTPGEGAPQLGLLAMLAATVGWPYVALSATSPLVSAWVARAAPGTRPYRLYALSNTGSMLGLCGYPLLVEPALATSRQVGAWSALYALFALLCAGLAILVARGAGDADAAARGHGAAVPRGPRVAPRTRALWLALAFAPSALLVAVTNHLTQNVAAVPLLWVIPLAAYLASFILCFSADGRFYRRAVVLPVAAVLLPAMLWSSGISGDARRDTALFVAGLFFVATACHGELARRAPDPSGLTGFYLALSAGGVLGGAAIGFLAPLALPLAGDLPATLAVAAACLAAALDGAVRAAATRPMLLRFRLVAAVVVLGIAAGGAAQVIGAQREARASARNFYGALSVQDDGDPGQRDAIRALHHGQISHGVQYLHPRRSLEPTAYYGPETGVGAAMSVWDADRPRRLGVVGLGIGTLAVYGRSGDALRFYEINPLVIDFARREFTFLSAARADVSIATGDARLVLEEEPPQGFDLLVLDAFSGDAVPVHLLTREAFRLYRRHLAPSGLLAIHGTNRYLDLVPVIARTAQAEGAQVRVAISQGVPGERARYMARWVLVAWPEAAARPAWSTLGTPVETAPGRPWTDDYSDLWGAMK